MTEFIGRREELAALKLLLQKRSASLIVIRGRRRIGKTRLAEEFAKSFNQVFIFTGLPPRQCGTEGAQLDEFRRQMREQNINPVGADNWGDLFYLLAKECNGGRILVVLDEITWMGSKDPDFLGKFKIAWDLYFKKNPKLCLILSGSNSAWIDKNILSSTGFVGRISHRVALKDLSLGECDAFWGNQRKIVSAYEKFKFLSVTGGIPRYLEEIIPELSAEENIRRLCFHSSGLLFSEFNDIFSDLFSTRAPRYRKLLRLLINGSLSQQAMSKKLERSRGGDLADAMTDLVESGFVTRDYSWHIQDGSQSKHSTYRLSDNYVRFYLKHIFPNRTKIEKQLLRDIPASWLGIMGLQFENLVMNNIKLIFPLLSIPHHELVCASPYLQTKTARRSKCQIDLLIQTRYHQLYVGEIKFSSQPIGQGIVKEVCKKIESLERPKGFSCRPFLVHVNGVTDAVVSTDYFSKIIDFGSLFALRCCMN